MQGKSTWHDLSGQAVYLFCGLRRKTTCSTHTPTGTLGMSETPGSKCKRNWLLLRQQNNSRPIKPQNHYIGTTAKPHQLQGHIGSCQVQILRQHKTPAHKPRSAGNCMRPDYMRGSCVFMCVYMPSTQQWIPIKDDAVPKPSTVRSQ